ncbi:hypothetical protein [Sulfitobacter sp.]|jgi:hypothetical protein|uniref:hypothetical protein n=1 Tax=Sulfitobacter sp. TaxID=1903071 RepID=UPI003071C348
MTLAEKARAGRRIALEALAEARTSQEQKNKVMFWQFRSVRPLVLRHHVENIFAFKEIASYPRQAMPYQIAS